MTATPTRRHVPPPALSPDAYADDSKCATGVILLLDLKNLELVVVPSLCHRWDCPVCGPIRMRKAKAMAIAGNPERILTLTTRPKDGWTTEASVRWFRRRWQRLLAWLRKNFKGFEYMAFVELHKSGWPHMHILTRGEYVPQRMLAEKWLKLTGSYMVSIQAMRRGWKGVHECTKYCLKTARQLHDQAPTLPVYTKSKKWLPDDWDDDKDEERQLTPYAYGRMPWEGFLALVEELGGTLEPRPGEARRFNVRFRAPPDPKAVAFIYDLGSFGDKAVLAAIDLYYHNKASGSFDVDDMKDQVDYYTNPGAEN